MSCVTLDKDEINDSRFYIIYKYNFHILLVDCVMVVEKVSQTYDGRSFWMVLEDSQWFSVKDMK